MRRWMGGVVVGVLLGLPVVRAGQAPVIEMTSERVQEAIKQGESSRQIVYVASGGHAWFTTPYLRVVAAAAQAKKLHKPFTAADVTPAMTASELHVGALPYEASDPGRSNVAAIVIYPKGTSAPADAIQPVRTAALTLEEQTLFGKLTSDGKIAVFPLSALAEGNELVVVYEGRPERRSRFKLKDVR